MGRISTWPTVALMVDSRGRIVAVLEAFVDEKQTMGWFLVARDSDILSEPVPVRPYPIQSNPRRITRGDKGYVDGA